MMNTLYVSADVSLDSLDVATATTPALRQGLGRLSNDPAGWQELAAQVRQIAQSEQATTIHLILEPTGGYEEGLLYFAYAQGWQVTRVNPLQVRRWAEGQGVRAKTDRQDALVLAWYGATTQPSPQDPMEEGATELDELLRRRTDLEQLQRAEKNRLAQAQRRVRTPKSVLQSLERTLRTLDEELQALEEAIKQLLKERTDLQQQRRFLRTAPAIGEKLSLEMLALCHRFWAYTQGKGTGKQLVAFVGLDPQPHQSGKSRDRSPISHQGNARTRSQLYCGALGGIRGDNALRHFYHRLVAGGKAKKLALVACARKVLIWVWAIFTSNTPFDPARFPVPDEIHP
jgi:transposase